MYLIVQQRITVDCHVYGVGFIRYLIRLMVVEPDQCYVPYIAVSFVFRILNIVGF